MKFTLTATPETAEKIKEMFQKEERGNESLLPLFSLRTKDEKGNERQFNNMLLTRILLKCKECNFSLRLSEIKIMNAFRLKKTLGVESAKTHIAETGHSMEVNQSFKKYVR